MVLSGSHQVLKIEGLSDLDGGLGVLLWLRGLHLKGLQEKVARGRLRRGTIFKIMEASELSRREGLLGRSLDEVEGLVECQVIAVGGRLPDERSRAFSEQAILVSAVHNYS